MTPNEAIRRITQRAMERHRLSQRGLAHEIGCGEGSIAKILGRAGGSSHSGAVVLFDDVGREAACVTGCSWAHTPALL